MLHIHLSEKNAINYWPSQYTKIDAPKNPNLDATKFECIERFVETR